MIKYFGWIIGLIFIGIFILFYNFKYLPTESDLIKQTDENIMWQTQFQELKKAKEVAAYQKVIEMNNLFTQPTSFSLTKKGEIALKEILPELQDRSGTIMVGGHTDNTTVSSTIRSKYPSNWEYSSAKAIVVLKYLISLGIKPERLIAMGYADTRPIADNATQEGRKQNRRIEIMVKSE